MRNLLLLALILIAPIAAQAQTTNITYVLTIEEGTTRTNSFTNSLAAIASIGMNVAYDSYRAASTNNTDNFRQFARQYFKDVAERPLKQLGNDYQLATSRVGQIQQSIAVNWENANAAQRKLLLDWLTAFPVP